MADHSPASSSEDPLLEMEFPMWVISADDLLAIDHLTPHEELMEQGKLVQFTPEMRHVFFVSHQWTSLSEPDHGGEQLAALQGCFERMRRGVMPPVSATYSDRLTMGEIAPAGTTAEDWARIVRDAYVWMDYTSIPQRHAMDHSGRHSFRMEHGSSDVSAEFSGRTDDSVGLPDDELQRAVNSIPAYVEAASHFFILCPPAVMKSTGHVCNLSTWFHRGWCRLEQQALMLQTRSRVPAIVLRGPEATPLMLPMCFIAPVGMGDFKCCARNHMIERDGGFSLPIPCDKQMIGELLGRMLDARIEIARHRGDVDEVRLWSSLRPFYLRGLPVEYDNLVRPSASGGSKGGKTGSGRFRTVGGSGKALIGGAGSASGGLCLPCAASAAPDAAARQPSPPSRGVSRGLIMSEFAAADASAESSVEPPPLSAPGAESAASAQSSGERLSTEPTRLSSEPAATATDEEVKEFLAAYGFEGGVSDRGADGKGVFPLLCAVLANDAPLVRALLKAGADPNLAYEGKQREGHFFALHQGTTAVHLAPLSDHSNDGVVMRELLRAGGDPGRVTSRGASPLMFLAAVSYDAAGGIKTLRDACRDTGVPLDIEYQIPVNSATALQLAAYMSQPATVAAILDIGGKARHSNDHGSSIFANACENENVDLPTLERLLRESEEGVIARQNEPKNAKWLAIDLLFETLTACGIQRGSELAQTVANTRGATPLHCAAMVGQPPAVIKWLLEHGAAPSLFVRNKAGRTPLEVARLFGPFPQTELELQLAEKAEGLRQRVAAARAEREAEVQARGVGRTASMQGSSRNRSGDGGGGSPLGEKLKTPPLRKAATTKASPSKGERSQRRAGGR